MGEAERRENNTICVYVCACVCVGGGGSTLLLNIFDRSTLMLSSSNVSNLSIALIQKNIEENYVTVMDQGGGDPK